MCLVEKSPHELHVKPLTQFVPIIQDAVWRVIFLPSTALAKCDVVSLAWSFVWKKFLFRSIHNLPHVTEELFLPIRLLQFLLTEQVLLVKVLLSSDTPVTHPGVNIDIQRFGYAGGNVSWISQRNHLNQRHSKSHAEEKIKPPIPP